MNRVTQQYLPRLADRLIGDILASSPALMLVGPRACGKTTTARRFAADVVQLDRPAEAVAFTADPDAALQGRPEPILLDEWQEVPAVLGAIKRAIDADPRPGRFLITGSIWGDLEAPTWPGTGRVVRLPLYGLTVRELRERTSETPMIDRLAAGTRPSLPPERPNLREYLGLMLMSGFPEPALHLDGPARRRWLAAYIDQLLTRDAVEVEPRRDPARLRLFFEALALNSAGTVADGTLNEIAGLNRKTARAYERLLTNLFVVDDLPGWSNSRLKRLVRRRKRYLVDPALAAAAIRVDAAAILQNGDLLGRMLDTFVMAQLRAEAPYCESEPRFYHVRTEQGRHEVDILAEVGAGRVIAIEVKASASPTAGDAGHLRWFRDVMGDRFVQGVILHTGPEMYVLDDAILAVPICAIWG